MCDYPLSLSPRTGWGQALSEEKPAGIRVINCAVSGRSTRSFIHEGHLERIALCIEKGDVLLAQFGHNDEKLSDPLRGTEPEGEYTKNLSQMAALARAKGAGFALLTPVARRKWENQALLHTHGEYPGAMKRLAQAERIPLIDMEKKTEELLRRLGEEESRRLYMHIAPGHPNYPEGLADDTHLTDLGAHMFCSLVRDEITELF